MPQSATRIFVTGARLKCPQTFLQGAGAMMSIGRFPHHSNPDGLCGMLSISLLLISLIQHIYITLLTTPEIQYPQNDGNVE